MKTQLLIFAILVFSLPLFGQSIYSGVYGIDDYHYDFNPDTILPQPPNNEVNIMEIDLNGDGTNDFRFSCLYRQRTWWYTEKRITLEKLNQNQIACMEVDSCWSNDTPPIFVYSTYPSLEMGYNELIDNGLSWTDSIVNLSFYEFNASFPTNFGFTCRRDSQFESDTGYIAVRIFALNDTLYGWIKISDVDWASCVIHEFACNNLSTNIKDYDVHSEIVIHPNPSDGNFTVRNLNPANSIKSIKVYNSVRLLKEFQFTFGGHVQINLAFLPDGLYFLQVETSDGRTVIKKVIINKN